MIGLYWLTQPATGGKGALGGGLPQPQARVLSPAQAELRDRLGDAGVGRGWRSRAARRARAAPAAVPRRGTRRRSRRGRGRSPRTAARRRRRAPRGPALRRPAPGASRAGGAGAGLEVSRCSRYHGVEAYLGRRFRLGQQTARPTSTRSPCRARPRSRRPRARREQLGHVGGPRRGACSAQSSPSRCGAQHRARLEPSAARAGRARVASSRRASWRGGIAGRGYRPRHERPAPGRSEHPRGARRRPPAEQGAPLLGGPVLAAPYHLRGAKDAAEYGYGRDQNPTWTAFERALGELDGGQAVAFASGMAAVSAVTLRLRPGDLLVAPATATGHPHARRPAAAPAGVRVRFVETDTDALVAARRGRDAAVGRDALEPAARVCDLRAVADAAHAAGALLAVDNTLATPLGSSRSRSAPTSPMTSATKPLSGHSDLLLGAVSVARAGAGRGAARLPLAGRRDPRAVRDLAARTARSRRWPCGSAHGRERAGAGPRARGARRRRRRTYPGLDDPVAAAQMTATGRGGLLAALGRARPRRSSTAAGWSPRRRASAGSSRPPSGARAGAPTTCREGFIRFSAGCEDTADLLADVLAALDAA